MDILTLRLKLEFFDEAEAAPEPSAPAPPPWPLEEGMVGFYRDVRSRRYTPDGEGVSLIQERLGELGAPPYRLEVSSVLRTPADQAALRRVNPNAALGESTHEYATTVDVLYSAYAAPAEPIAPSAGDAASARILERYAGVAAERVAGRRALELKAILGHVLLELQDEGRVMVTLERLQPVYHMTVAQAP